MLNESRRAPALSRKSLEALIIAAIVLIGAIGRTVTYGDLRLSLGNADTSGYIASSRFPLLSWQAFAGQRLFTTNLIFKLANDPQGCRLVAVSEPAGGRHARPTLQACFDKIALLQNILAILAWCLLAWMAARWMETIPAKVAVAGAIMLFGFTPQIAEWDTILGPESLSVTGLVALLALLLEIALGVASGSEKFGSTRNTALTILWLFIFTLWTFLRDAHLYALVVTLVMISTLLLLAQCRRPLLWAVIGTLLGLLVLGYASASASRRASIPLSHVFGDYILPIPERVAFFQQFGMPQPGGPAYSRWVDSSATRAYAAFLLTHPGFVVQGISMNRDYFRAEFMQTYFEPRAEAYRALAIQVGKIVHPETLAVYSIDLISIVALWFASMRGPYPEARGWAWTCSWFLLVSGALLFVGFFGDAEAVRRHMYVGVEAFRLVLWPLLFVSLDLCLRWLQRASRPRRIANAPA